MQTREPEHGGGSIAMTSGAVSGAVSKAAPQGVSWQRALARHYVLVQLFWNPVLCAVAVLALGTPEAWARSFAVALVIAAVASSVCFLPIAGLLALQQRASARQSAAPARGRGFYLGVALLCMPLGMLLAAEVTERVFGVRAPSTASDYRFAIFLGLIISGVFFLWQSLRDARAEALALELRVKVAETHELQAQLAALTAQLNPHLMFNALNTIAELVRSDAELAERTVLRLSDLYRGVLRATQRQEHSLQDELSICQAYLDLERTRFQDRLQTRVVVEPGVDVRQVQVPVLVLQPLVENAVTHGLLDRARGGSVSIAARAASSTLELEVLDDGIGLGQSARSGAGLGVENTRRRLELRYGEQARLELCSPPQGGTLATLRLPLQLA
jgi:two-component sensor histidine kinase